MEEVYDQLVEEGFLDRIVGRGTFVSLHVGSLVARVTIKRRTIVTAHLVRDFLLRQTLLAADCIPF